MWPKIADVDGIREGGRASQGGGGYFDEEPVAGTTTAEPEDGQHEKPAGSVTMPP